MKPTARLIVVEPVIPEGAAFHFGKWTDLQMLVCIGGRERTETEYRALLSTAGFDLQEVIPTESAESSCCNASIERIKRLDLAHIGAKRMAHLWHR